MANYYQTAIINALDKLNENKLCFVYTLLMQLFGEEYNADMKHSKNGLNHTVILKQ